ncbi:Acetyltransferase (GNAT) domain-containing protein [Sporobacter termitidis DSM 10068]|uniref:Acetyltransferase (GNAT) domain-containing protein n=1 Tax=Sporobacter termitidis DSM 10068 TaxID=1123282 RepID=A0A1M5X387_9FIRM|nr:GNAT family N-acetyltransferase [Sporobacter termitidis]SHH94251.1 Acetyltransferase (GNAT) domain-containing protein [Sporobacter termitidis DSM 10068]
MADIREVHDGELDRCAEVIRRGFQTVADDFGLTEERVPTNGAYIKTERLIADRAKGNLMYALTEDDRIVGFMQLENAGNGTFYLEKISVVPEYRHRGYGTALLDFAREKAKEMGAHKLGIAIIEENGILKEWYIKNGCVPTGSKKFEHLPFTVGFLELSVGE